MAPADNQLVGTGHVETHLALFEWTFGAGGAKQGRQTVRIKIRDLAQVS
jgi:hypothetical protein